MSEFNQEGDSTPSVDSLSQAQIGGDDLLSPSLYAKRGHPLAAWKVLRREDPVHYCEGASVDPFWAITKHADIIEISKNPTKFLNAPGVVILGEEQKASRGEGIGELRTIIEMDPPEHGKMRKVAAAWFTPRALGRLDEAINLSARRIVDQLAGDGDVAECDFATDVAARHPLRILATILGVAREQEDTILTLTNQLFASDDAELQRPGESRREALMEIGMELFGLFSEIIEDRRANPRDDLASVLANARVDGEELGVMETFGYYLIVFTAGHDTTKNALAGGMRALLDHPEQVDVLRRDPSLVETAVEELVRWTTPVSYMRRTAAHDVEVRGKTIREGDQMALFYCSANRDEEVFADGDVFRVDRDPNPHLGFGIGEHFCMGAHLARRSQVALLRELLPRLEEAEITAEPEWIGSNFVVGLKHLPIRYRIAVG